jgi:hypothetical protein
MTKQKRNKNICLFVFLALLGQLTFSRFILARSVETLCDHRVHGEFYQDYRNSGRGFEYDLLAQGLFLGFTLGEDGVSFRGRFKY